MHHRYKGALFLSVFILLGVQFIFARTIDEPYPAVVFPAFGKAPQKTTPGITTSRATTTLSYEVVAIDQQGERLEHGEDVLFGAMPPATKYRNIRRICPLPSDLEREQQSIQKHRHKTHYKLKMWLKYELARGYYKPDDRDVSAWLEELKRARSLASLSVLWLRDGEVKHECSW